MKMHTIKLNIHDSIYDKLLGLLEILPKDKLEIIEDNDYPAISFKEARQKAERAINNIDKNEGISLDEAFNKFIR
jgi:hypothetical protein